MSIESDLVGVYVRYGFNLEKKYGSGNVFVFVLNSGYFNNADIVVLPGGDPAQAFSEFSELKYACSVRTINSVAEAENLLYTGFFSIEQTRSRLLDEYAKFASSIVDKYSNSAEYRYINAPYEINGEEGGATVPDEVLSRLGEDRPILFLIEAAAGYGKTCTAYELLKRIVDKGDGVPLFAELARHRQARVFKHILFEEIYRTFPLLGSRLVQSEMLSGRVITILDGFDELLRESDVSGEFDDREPMLETIGEYLKGSSKIILTTRRTVLFDGDEFHKWLDRHQNEFDLVRIRISEPRLVDWIELSRRERLLASGLDVEDIPNPVLLSYLRCIPDDEFEQAVSTPGRIVDSYFTFMFEREKTRQDLLLTNEQQIQVLRSVASDMIKSGYTSEARDYIVLLISESNKKIIDEAILLYPAAERPTREEVANKLASHALFDRNARNQSNIGFINEFVLGHFVGATIIEAADWLNDDVRFIEPAVMSYQPRGLKDRTLLWERLCPSLDFCSNADKVDAASRLIGTIPFDLIDGEVDGIAMTKIVLGNNRIENFQFNECAFNGCEFVVSGLDEVTFLNCRFYDCKISGNRSSGDIYLLGGVFKSDFENELKDTLFYTPDSENATSREGEAEAIVLERFWPVGRETITHKHRPIKGLCGRSGDFSSAELYSAIQSLKRRQVLREPRNPAFVEINFESILEIRRILKRDTVHG